MRGPTPNVKNLRSDLELHCAAPTANELDHAILSVTRTPAISCCAQTVTPSWFVYRFSELSMGLLWIVDHLPEVNIRDTQDSAERIGDLY